MTLQESETDIAWTPPAKTHSHASANEQLILSNASEYSKFLEWYIVFEKFGGVVHTVNIDNKGNTP